MNHWNKMKTSGTPFCKSPINATIHYHIVGFEVEISGRKKIPVNFGTKIFIRFGRIFNFSNFLLLLNDN